MSDFTSLKECSLYPSSYPQSVVLHFYLIQMHNLSLALRTCRVRVRLRSIVLIFYLIVEFSINPYI